MPDRRRVARATLVVLVLGAVAATAAAPAAGSVAPAAAPAAAPARAEAAATLPATTCTLAGRTRTCELWAKPTSVSLPAGSVPPSVAAWGYADSAGGPATVPGPTLVATKGETLRVVLHNELTVATSLALPQQPVRSDRSGAAPGGSHTYLLALSRPGTFSYEAGLTAEGPRQVAMGLGGMLVVRPQRSGSAYGASASSYDDETAIILQSVDPAMAANPVGFDLGRWAPRYWLLNGRSYPDTTDVATAPGHRVLLRIANVGVEDRSVSLVGGVFQTVVADAGFALARPYTVLAETVPAGSTLDTVVDVPVGVPTGTRYALLDSLSHLDNAGASTGGQVDFGGALTFLQVGVPAANNSR